MPSVVELKSLTTGRRIDAFDSLHIELSMLRPGRSWSFELFRSGPAPGGPDSAPDPLTPERRATAWSEVTRIQLGELVRVSIDGAPQLVGYVESCPIHDNGRSGQSVVISGTDFAGRAMHASADPGFSSRGLDLFDVLAGLFEPLGLDVQMTAAASARATAQTPVAITRRADRRAPAPGTRRRVRVDLAHAEPGETVWQVADGAVRRAGLMMWVGPTVDGRMSVIVDVPNYEQTPQYAFVRQYRERGGQTPASNIETLTLNRSIEGLPTSVTVYAHAPRGGGLPSRIAEQHPNEHIDFIVRDIVDEPPPMPFHVPARKARTRTAALAEARRITADALAQARTADVVVRGFQQDGLLYALNSMASVFDQNTPCLNPHYVFGPLDENMLIQEISFTRSRKEGERTKLNLGTFHAIDLEPQESA